MKLKIQPTPFEDLCGYSPALRSTADVTGERNNQNSEERECREVSTESTRDTWRTLAPTCASAPASINLINTAIVSLA